MAHAEILIAGLLVAVAGLSAFARRVSIPYPIMLVIGGAIFGFIPGLPAIPLDPIVVLAAVPSAPAVQVLDLRQLRRLPREPPRPHAEHRGLVLITISPWPSLHTR